MQSEVDAPCPQCAEGDTLTMLAMNSEIPYFGEHTQITVLCSSCGWRHTDFIPSDGEKPGFSSLVVDNEQRMMVRVVRSSSCTIRIPDLDLEVSPGGSSSGYVTNIEGVIKRFENAIETIIRSDDDGMGAEIATKIMDRLRRVKQGKDRISVELLDPRGRSQIIHGKAISRELNDTERVGLETGPEIPVFDLS
ncbi:MAG: ZPR1 zinc finger domain-containing protein [Candidatus Thalassarchaeaceae archaeon]